MPKLMARLFIVIGLSLFLLHCSDQDQSPVGSGNVVEPESLYVELTLSETEFDFGTVPQQSVVSHLFYLHATGTDTLRILDIKPG